MPNKDNYWELILKSFDQFEKTMDTNLEDKYLDQFFSNYDELINKLKPEDWQLQELKIKFEKINEKLDEAKFSLDKERLEQGQKQINFGRYLKNLELNKK